MKIFIKHMYLAMYFGQYLGFRVIGLYIYIYILLKYFILLDKMKLLLV